MERPKPRIDSPDDKSDRLMGFALLIIPLGIAIIAILKIIAAFLEKK